MTKDDQLRHQFDNIMEQQQGILHRVARTYCRNEDDRQDLLQDMMIQIWKSLPRYNSKFAMTTWLYRIALNVAISFYRYHARQQSVNIPWKNSYDSDQEDTVVEKQEQLHQLEQFISSLNDFDKALMLLYLDEKSYAEISIIMGVSVSNVGTKLGRIREKLKQKFSTIKS